MPNAILPGVYVDVIAGEREKPFGTTGVVTMPLALSWGDKIVTLVKGENPFVKLGYRMKDTEIKLINEVMNSAERLILYRLNDGAKASVTLCEGLTATAIYSGTRGNDISIIVKKSGDVFAVESYLDTLKVDTQIIKTAAEFKTNKWFSISGEGTLSEVTVRLASGANGTVSDTAFDEYLQEIEKHNYNIMCYTGNDVAVQQKLVTFINRMRDEQDIMVQAVMCGSGFDNKAIINNTVGGKTALYDLSAHEACATMAGISAKCGITDSATYFDKVVGWLDVVPRLNQIELETRTQNGEILFTLRYGKIMVLYDINSLTTFTETNPKDFGKNLVIRTLDKYAMDLQYLLNTKAIGKIRNHEDGRNKIKGFIATMTIDEYQSKGFVDVFTASDVTVKPTFERDSVEVTVGIRVADTVDKIYITVTAL